MALTMGNTLNIKLIPRKGIIATIQRAFNHSTINPCLTMFAGTDLFVLSIQTKRQIKSHGFDYEVINGKA